MRGALLLALTGCSSLFGLHEPSRTDASVDAGDGPTGDASQCFGRGDLTVCMVTLPGVPVQLPATIDTSSSPVCTSGVGWLHAGQPDACFIVGTNIMQSGTTVVTGARPLVIVATDSIAITGLLDASSHSGGTRGPGANSPSCAAFASAPQPSTSGAGGGAGGTFATTGGTGGGGDVGLFPGGMPAAAVGVPATLRGGCAGQVGGAGQSALKLAIPGDGGGALYLLGGTTITLTGARIAANGAGSVAGGDRSGGGGGGAGGMIVIDAPSIQTTNSFVSANGGGGSSGADGTSGPSGKDGLDPDPATPTQPAAGGPSGAGGPGGTGYAGGIAAGAGQDSPPSTTRGGGGGGGGAGYILAPGPLGIASPAITMLP